MEHTGKEPKSVEKKLKRKQERELKSGAKRARLNDVDTSSTEALSVDIENKDEDQSFRNVPLSDSIKNALRSKGITSLFQIQVIQPCCES